MKTRTQRLTTLADRMEANSAFNRMDWKRVAGESIVAQVKHDIDFSLHYTGEVDSPQEENYLAGPNFNRPLVMYCITGDHDWLPDDRVDPHITF